MSEENVSENTVELPIQGVADWQQAATEQEHGADRSEYGSDQKGLERATSDRVQRRKEIQGDDAPPPILKHVGKDAKNPFKAANDVAFSKRMAIASEIHADDPSKSAEQLYDETLDTIDPPPVEIKLDHKERGRWEGISQPEAAEQLKTWREDQARQQAEEAAALQGQQAEHEAQQAREAEQYEQSVAQQAEYDKAAQQAAQQAEAEQRHYLAEQARQNSQQHIANVETQARHEAAQIQQYGAANFGDLLHATPAQIEHLRQTNPARYAAYVQLNQGAARVVQTLQQVEQVKQQSTREAQAQTAARDAAALEAAIAQHDQAADAYIAKNFADIPKAEMRAQARETLRSAGLTDAQIHEAYFGGAPVSLRSSASQVLLAKAAAWDRAQARAAEVRNGLRAKQSPPPPVQRPGVAGQVSVAADQSNINELTRQLRGATGRKALELGVKLTQARRARG